MIFHLFNVKGLKQADLLNIQTMHTKVKSPSLLNNVGKKLDGFIIILKRPFQHQTTENYKNYKKKY